MKDIRKFLYKAIIQALNTDQVNHIGNLIDRKFDVGRISGFENVTSMPKTTAAETVIKYFQKSEDLIRYYEIMLNYHGRFLYDSYVHVKNRQEFINVLYKKGWIYDPDLQLFLKDNFFFDDINFLESIRVLDLRKEVNFNELLTRIKKAGENLRAIDLEWSIDMRMYGLTREVDELMQSTIEMLLAKQNLTPFTYNIYFCLRELAMNAGKAGYKHLYEKYLTKEKESSGEYDYTEILRLFRDEIYENRDMRLVELARKEDLYFDLYYKSNKHSISIWTQNYTPISKIEKIRLLDRLHISLFDDEDRFINIDDQYAEGAGMGIMMVMNILKSLYPGKEPLKVVFYPNSTKIGFVIFRADMEKMLDEL